MSSFAVSPFRCWELGEVGSGVVNGELLQCSKPSVSQETREDNLEFEWLVCHELLDILFLLNPQ